MKIKNMSSRYSGESQPINSKSNNIEIMIGNDTSEIINEALVSFLLDIKYVYKTSMKSSDFLFIYLFIFLILLMKCIANIIEV